MNDENFVEEYSDEELEPGIDIIVDSIVKILKLLPNYFDFKDKFFIHVEAIDLEEYDSEYFLILIKKYPNLYSP